MSTLHVFVNITNNCCVARRSVGISFQYSSYKSKQLLVISHLTIVVVNIFLSSSIFWVQGATPSKEQT